MAPITVGSVTRLGFKAETKHTGGAPSYFDLKQSRSSFLLLVIVATRPRENFSGLLSIFTC